jgi:hypothetical protein
LEKQRAKAILKTKIKKWQKTSTTPNELQQTLQTSGLAILRASESLQQSHILS